MPRFAAIDTLSDLIGVLRDGCEASGANLGAVDVAALTQALPQLERLNAFIGVGEFKQQLLRQVMYYNQHLHCTNDRETHDGGDYMHAVITGGPGTGKTELAHGLAELFATLGVLKTATVHKVSRADLVAGYLGQTAIKTRDAVEKALDGILFIDEAYSLGGDNANSDSYSKECIDTLCELLSVHRSRLFVIIAGYEADLQRCFFSKNIGLRSRFMWWYHLPDYDPHELMMIFLKQLRDAGWSIGVDADKLNSWFLKNRAIFKYNGRDIQTFMLHVKIAYSERLYRSGNDNVWKLITMDDIVHAGKAFSEMDATRSSDSMRKAVGADPLMLQMIYA